MTKVTLHYLLEISENRKEEIITNISRPYFSPEERHKEAKRRYNDPNHEFSEDDFPALFWVNVDPLTGETDMGAFDPSEFEKEEEEEEEEGSPVYTYHINLDERGEFYADVRDPDGETVYEIKGFDIFEDGFMKHDKDVQSLTKYLRDLKVIPESVEIEMED